MVILTHIEDPIKWVLRTGLSKQQPLQVSLLGVSSEWPTKRQVTTKASKVANSFAVGCIFWLTFTLGILLVLLVVYMDPL